MELVSFIRLGFREVLLAIPAEPEMGVAGSSWLVSYPGL